jgi:hypothetical protein
MKTFALTAFAFSFIGCLPPLHDPSYTDGPATSPSYPSYNTNALQVCDAVQQDPSQKSTLEGQWQDWGGSYKVFTFKDSTLTVTSDTDQGKPSNEATGKYTVSDQSVAVTWDDGKAESADFSIENYPGCEMLTVSNNSASDSRIPVTTFGDIERVNCHFDGALADNTTTTPVTR